MILLANYLPFLQGVVFILLLLLLYIWILVIPVIWNYRSVSPRACAAL